MSETNEPSNEKEKVAVQRFLDEVCSKHGEADLEEVDWYDLSIGFFLACGLDVEASMKLAIHVRYDLQYGEGDD